jgi:hypothetical protein
MCKHLCM